MITADKAEFKAILNRSARTVGKEMLQDDIEFFYTELKEYSLRTIEIAVKRAMNDRDPDDVFLKRSPLTVQEIRTAAEKILEAEVTDGKVGCEHCNGKGWIISEDELRRLVARPCECLYKVTKERFLKKGKPSRFDAYKRKIVAAYEAHQKKWGEEPK